MFIYIVRILTMYYTVEESAKGWDILVAMERSQEKLAQRVFMEHFARYNLFICSKHVLPYIVASHKQLSLVGSYTKVTKRPTLMFHIMIMCNILVYFLVW